MARIRSIKPELRRDLTVASWPRDARYAWVLLWGYLDDAGRGVDDLRLLTADLFPLDRDVSEKKLDAWLYLMTQPGPGDPEGPLCRYVVGDVRYLHAINWRHQRINRPSPSLNPPCPLHDGSLNPHGVVTEGSSLSRVPADQGSREQGEKNPPNPPETGGNLHQPTNPRALGTNPRGPKAASATEAWLASKTGTDA